MNTQNPTFTSTPPQPQPAPQQPINPTPQFTPAPAQPAAATPMTPVQPRVDEALKPLHTMPSVTTHTAQKPMSQSSSKVGIFLIFLAAAAGVATGFGSYKLFNTSAVVDQNGVVRPASGSRITDGAVFGDTKASENEKFNEAQGYLVIGGFEGEGSHHLLRSGGPSQTVYITSSVVDLDQFEGAEIKVWGETNKPQKVGWLMDVVKVEVVKAQGEDPSGE